MPDMILFNFFFFFNDTATTEIYTLSLHDALPICARVELSNAIRRIEFTEAVKRRLIDEMDGIRDRKSTRLNSSHVRISYAVFCFKKKNNTDSLHYLTY